MVAAAAPSAAGRSQWVALSRIGLGWAVVAALLVAWELAAVAAAATSLATLSDTLAAFWSIVTGPSLHRDVLASLGRTLAGYGVAVAAGWTFGLTIGSFRTLEGWVRPVLEFLRAIPPPLLIPLATIVLGLNARMAVAIIAFAAFWPVLLNAIDGARQVEPAYLEAARALQMGGWERLWRVVLPASLPQVAAGLRIALSTALIVMVIAEMVGVSSGIGHLILVSQQSFQVAMTYGGVLVIAVAGWLLDTLFLAGERRLLAWHRHRGGHQQQ